ncbi:histidine phosphatase family protein [Calidifontibacillus erzurumensis]|uniref:Phosphoglycerate mutase family protein n=1 Tax=Calidifontibacillus erzurumensis TaxID=2741433 RepID=A0A8J8GEE8_9BACI|nr:phosphoglycerate mutase family protein [Calidifontibacillus erzurumensis]NSL50883.1 phosphoglycerate mutase family protein [Calidifontibacillus erzurumensis]
MELLMVRHLPTEWNKMGILQGLKDIPILPVLAKDKKKIKENRKVIERFNPEIVLVSELIRTKQTALEYGFDHPVIEPLLNELHFGLYEGTLKKELEKNKQWFVNPRLLRFGEHLIHFEQRIVNFLNKYCHYSRVLAFGHGSWMRACMSLVQVGTIEKMNQVIVENNELIHLPKIEIAQLGREEASFDVSN